MNEAELGPTAFWIVSSLGVLSGLFSLWAFRRWTDTAKLRTAINRILAHLLEFRLFGDEPALVMRAQRDLLVANAQFLREVTGPSLLLAVPFALLCFGLYGMFGRAPLRLEKPAVVTVQFLPLKENLPAVQLLAPAGIQVETPPIRLPASSQVCWRVRPHRALSGFLELKLDGRVFTKSISSASRIQWLSPVRDGSLARFLAKPFEWPFANQRMEAVELSYPEATIFGASWIVLFSISCVAGGIVYAGATYLRY